MPLFSPRSRLPFLALVLSVLATTCLSRSSEAAILIVDNLSDNGAAGTLRSTIAASQSGDTIFITGYSSRATLELNGTELLINKNLTIRGPGGNTLTIARKTAEGTPEHRIFNIAPGVSVDISRLNIANGSVTDSTSRGGAIYNAGTLTLSNCALYNNSAGVDDVYYGQAGQGGAIYNAGKLIVKSTTLRDNSAYRGQANSEGGGIYNTGELTFDNSTLVGNYASLGAGIHNNGPLTINNSTISSNSSNVGGGLYNTKTATAKNCTFSGNEGDFYGEAGAIYNEGNLALGDSSVSGNFARRAGGISNYGNFTISNSEISGNSAQSGAGILNSAFLTVTNSTISYNSSNGLEGDQGSGGGVGNGGEFNLINSTISGNFSDGPGGGIFNGGQLKVSSSTITGNLCGGFDLTGGGIANYLKGSVNVKSSIIVGNNLNDVAMVDGNYPNNFFSDGYNLVGTGSNVYTSDGPVNTVTAFNQPTDKRGVTLQQLKLGALADNGGPTHTHALLAGSLAIDKGQTSSTTDQTGRARPYDNPAIPNASGGDGSDIGAFEFPNPESSRPTITETSPFYDQKLLISAFKPGSLKGTASDDVGVVKVEMKLTRSRNGVVQIWNGTVWTTTSALVPASLSGNGAYVTWNVDKQFPPLSQLDEGEYINRMYATDALGIIGSTSTRFTLVASDSTAPEMQVATPTLNQKIYIYDFKAGSITGEASDNVGISAVKLKLSRKRGTQNYYWNGTAFTTTPFVLNATLLNPLAANTKWNLNNQTPGLGDLDWGAYKLEAYAVDVAGNKSTTIVRPFTIGYDFTAPNVAITSPTQSQTIALNTFGANTIKGTATDNLGGDGSGLGVTSVKVKLSRKRGTVTTYWNGSAFTTTVATVDAIVTNPGEANVTWRLSNAPTPAKGLDAGAYTLYATASDYVGNVTTTASRSFTLTAPTAGEAVTSSTGSANQF